METIGIIGGGKMAEAIIAGLLSNKKTTAARIKVSEIDAGRRRHLKKTYRLLSEVNNQKVIDQARLIILAVKPQSMPEALKGLKFSKSHLLISIAAGIPTRFFEKAFPGVPVIRAMPNNPALVGFGITAIAAGKYAGARHIRSAEKIFTAVGETVLVQERIMDAVTGLSGSGPAFVYQTVEAMAEGGVKAGLSRPTAEKLAVETVLGAAVTLKWTGRSPEELTKMVASPGGTTVEGLKVIDKRKMKQIMAHAVAAAAKRSRELSKRWTS